MDSITDVAQIEQVRQRPTGPVAQSDRAPDPELLRVGMNTYLRPKQTILLLGAGFTNDFGGYLSDRMWSLLTQQREIQECPELKAITNRSNYNYETAYDLVLKDEALTEEQKRIFKCALSKAYADLDAAICTDDPEQRSRACNACRLFLTRFAGLSGERRFIFTVNHDLFIERYFTAGGGFLIKIPGLEKPKWFRGLWTSPLELEDEVKLPTEISLRREQERFARKSNERLAYIKLHGSYGWKAADGSDVLVIGHGKTDIINKEPLLRWHRELFRDVLSREKRQLVVVGYGFGDENINAVIADARNGGLRLCIVTPKSSQDFNDELYPLHGNKLPKPRAIEILRDGDFLHFPHRITDFYNRNGQLTPPGRGFFEKLGL